VRSWNRSENNRIPDSGPPVMLDSGAFTAYMHGFEIDLDTYAEFLKTYGHYFIGGCINLDVIGDGKRSYQNWKELRRRGFSVIPVYHMGTDEQWLEKYVRQTDYVAIGAIASVRNKRRMLLGMRYLWRKYLLDDNGKPRLRIHGLGFSMRLARIFPWYSVDSSTAAKLAAHGTIFVPEISNVRYENGEIRFDYDIREFRGLHISGRGSIVLDRTFSAFHALPAMVRQAYERFFHSLGYRIGTVEARSGRDMPRHKLAKLKALERRGISLGQINPIIPDLTTQGGDCITGLANSWDERFDYNLEFLRKYCALCPSPIIYSATPNKALRSLEKFHLPLLISYWMIRKGPNDPLLLKLLDILNSFPQTLQEVDGEDRPQRIEGCSGEGSAVAGGTKGTSPTIC